MKDLIFNEENILNSIKPSHAAVGPDEVPERMRKWIEAAHLSAVARVPCFKLCPRKNSFSAMWSQYSRRETDAYRKITAQLALHITSWQSFERFVAKDITNYLNSMICLKRNNMVSKVGDTTCLSARASLENPSIIRSKLLRGRRYCTSILPRHSIRWTTECLSQSCVPLGLVDSYYGGIVASWMA